MVVWYNNYTNTLFLYLWKNVKTLNLFRNVSIFPTMRIILTQMYKIFIWGHVTALQHRHLTSNISRCRLITKTLLFNAYLMT